jgi:hypothetical protein
MNSSLTKRYGTPKNESSSPMTSSKNTYSKGSLTSHKWLKPADLLRYVGGVGSGKKG